MLGTHIMDLMRFLVGNPSGCFGQVLDRGRPVTRANVREGAEGIGPLAGDEIHAVYPFPSPTVGYFSTHRSRHGKAQRFGLHIYGTKGILTMTTGSLHQGNVLIAKDLIRAIEMDTQPRGSMYDGRAALEMILSVYESHRLGRPVELPLENREHPLGLL